jgi:CheY-like chemotaxis protein
MNILIVDDEPLVCRCLQLFLEFDGHQTDVAYSGDEALTKLDSRRFDLVFTDYFMAGMRGDQLARLIKQRAVSLPIVMVTGNPPSPLPNEICKMLLKPYSLTTVRAVVREFQSELIDSCSARERPVVQYELR